VPPQDKQVADIGCGDGIMALGVAHHANPARLVGFDVNLTNVEHLTRCAGEEGLARILPPHLSFVESTPEMLPAADAEFDIAYTWSAFEHIQNPRAVLSEIRRILKPDGVLFLQLWPFYFSERGSHLWDWFPEPFHHLVGSKEGIADAMHQSSVADDAWTEYMLHEFEGLNRITLDDLQKALIAAEFDVVRLELLTHSVTIPKQLGRSLPLTNLGIAGVKLMAVPRSWPTDELNCRWGPGKRRRGRARRRCHRVFAYFVAPESGTTRLTSPVITSPVPVAVALTPSWGTTIPWQPDVMNTVNIAIHNTSAGPVAMSGATMALSSNKTGCRHDRPAWHFYVGL
jgi:SAM-dependent methyltransferase